MLLWGGLRIRNTSLNLTRQSIQVGSEIIGIEKNSCESEIINLIYSL